MKETEKKYIVWINYESEGWSPTGYDTLNDAINHPNYGNTFVITSGALKLKIMAEEA